MDVGDKLTTTFKRAPVFGEIQILVLVQCTGVGQRIWECSEKDRAAERERSRFGLMQTETCLLVPRFPLRRTTVAPARMRHRTFLFFSPEAFLWATNILAVLIKACRSSVACPFLVHASPRRKRPSASKAHCAQLSREQISNGFAAARDASGFYAHLLPAERPACHEIISLGEHLRPKAGWPILAIQQLRGHTTEKMTRHYLEGHEWVRFEVPRARISD